MKSLSKVRKFKSSKFLLIAIACFLIAQAVTAGSLKVDITGLKNNKGFVRLVVYNTAESFPGDKTYYKLYKLKISGKKSILKINNLPKGDYAIALMHDENNNNKFDTNMLGIPKEGFGFSRNPRVILKEPDFKECKFSVNQAEERLSIRLKYF